MASNAQTVQKLLRNLRDSGKTLMQCGALTYIRSNAEKLDTSLPLSPEDYAEICELVMNMAIGSDQNIRNDATRALHAIITHFRKHSIKFFDCALRINRNKRPKIFQILETVDDKSLMFHAQNPATLEFAEDCLSSIRFGTMEWLSPRDAAEIVQILAQVEKQTPSDAEELEEILVHNALIMLRRIYKIAAIDTGLEKSSIQFDILVMEKVVTMAYMGHKRQRAPALSMLTEAVEGDLGTRIKTNYPSIWGSYKNNLQETYSSRMTLLVKIFESDWSSQWSISIKMLGTDLHRGATLINNLLGVEERAFKSADTTVRREAFASWQLLIDNFALDPQELATARRIKLLCVPLTAKNSKSESIALKKLQVWWYLIIKLYPNILPFADPVITQFLNFCFGPLGDTPLMSTKCDGIASPGKKFYKTKVIAVDALLQLVAISQRDRKAFTAVLDNRLPNCIDEALFKACHKSFLHCVGEAVNVISELSSGEMRNREEICKILWTNIMQHVQSVTSESKTNVCKELILVIAELQSRTSDSAFLNEFVRNVVIPELLLVSDNLDYHDPTLVNLIKAMMVPAFLKNLQGKQCDALKSLLCRFLRPETSKSLHPETLEIIDASLEALRSIPMDVDALTDCFDLWFLYVEMVCKYIKSIEIDSKSAERWFKIIESIISFPFTHMHWANPMLAEKIGVAWREIYKKFEDLGDAVPGVKKSDEIFNETSQMIEACLARNEKSFRIAAHCLDALIGCINYTTLLAQSRVPSIVRLIADIATIALHEGQPPECAECALRALSSLLITVYGHSPEKAVLYMTATSQTVELMLKADAEDTLAKEIVGTWETIVSILRGLGNRLDEKFLSAYKPVLLSSMRHQNPEVTSQTTSVLGLREIVKGDAQRILEDLAQEWRKVSGKETPKQRIEKGGERTPKQTRIAGSFLNRNVSTPRPEINREQEKAKPGTAKKMPALPPPEPESQDYVLIKTDVKLDVHRLTEHQLESFKRRRDDIPAMYNDLSQSNSHDTQELPKWLEGAKKNSEQTKSSNFPQKNTNQSAEKNEMSKSSNLPPKKSNEAGKIDDKSKSVGKKIAEKDGECGRNSPEIVASSGQDPMDDSGATIAELPAGDSFDSNKSEKAWTETRKKSVPRNPMVDHSYVRKIATPAADSTSRAGPKSTKMNFESVDAYISLINPKSGNRIAANRAKPIIVEDKTTVDSGPIAFRPTGKNGQEKDVADAAEASELPDKSSTEIPAAKSGAKGNSTTQDQSGISERGTKRKAASDSDTDDKDREKKRKKSAKSPETIVGTQNSGPSKDKRREAEMMRLRIDMVCDAPVTSRRRSKYSKDKNEELPSNTRTPRGQNGRSRGDTNPRKSSRASLEKEESNSDDLLKKRRRKNAKSESESQSPMEKGAEESQGSVGKIGGKGRNRRSFSITGSASLSQTIVDDEETQEEAVEPKIPEESSEHSRKNAPNSKNNSPKDIAEKPVAENEPETPELVENSQVSAVLTGSHRRSLAKLAKSNIQDNAEKCLQISPIKSSIDAKIPTSSSPIHPMEGKNTADKNANDKICIDDPDETFLDISAIRPQLADDVPMEENSDKKTPEASKTSPTSTKIHENQFIYSSPKAHTKRFAKAKGFTPQGRGAHMLGLVTKLACLEKEGQLEKSAVDEEIVAIKKMRSKENERSSKDVERIASPSGGSRQEKIFNKMKASTDYSASPPGKLFGNLRNDGEKISPKMDKSQINENGDFSSEDGNNSPLPSEKDELPILEWSSANPPSLTASPSASILKRIRLSVTDPEIDPTTPNKNSTRKRVSFADPPVSKEMGYEIEISGSSPHKISKFGVFRNFLVRKDSPIRVKQSRFKMIQIDPENMEKITPEEEETEEDMQVLSGDVDVDCARDNELLKRIAEDLEETADFQSSEKIDDTSLSGAASVPSSMETERNAGLKPFEDPKDASKAREISNLEASKEEIESSIDGKNIVGTEEMQTQDDLFNSSDEKLESPKKIVDLTNEIASSQLDISEAETTMGSFRLNVTADSTMSSFADDVQKKGASESLEETLDVRNTTNLNSTTNSEETYCENGVVTDTMCEMDTLPVTDSLLTQESQGSESQIVQIARPELLNSSQSIYPELANCEDSIEVIISDLAGPMWRTNLSKNLETRSIRTIGDLARLSEREVVRIPVKGSSKISFVRKVLRKFQRKTTINGDEKSRQNGSGLESAMVSNRGNSLEKSSQDIVEVDELSPEIQKNLGDISALNCESGKSSGNRESLDLSGLGFGSYPPQNSSIEDLDPHRRHALGRTSTTNSISTINIHDPSSDPSVCTILEDTTDVSQISTINLSSDTLPTATKSVAVGTDPALSICTRNISAQTISCDEFLGQMDLQVLVKRTFERISSQDILEQFKLKTGLSSREELLKEITRVLKIEHETALKWSSRECGLSKVLEHLSESFGVEKGFGTKVLKACGEKISVGDCFQSLSRDEVKEEVSKRFSSSEILGMLEKTLIDEDRRKIKSPISATTCLNSIIKRIPVDMMIRDTLSNEKLIPSLLLLETALRNNRSEIVTNTIEKKYPDIGKCIFERKLTCDNDDASILSCIEKASMSKDRLLGIYRAIAGKLDSGELLDAFHEAMRKRLDEPS